MESTCFSALQRAEIAEIRRADLRVRGRSPVSVLFNEPKLLKFDAGDPDSVSLARRFSALQRAEIAEIRYQDCVWLLQRAFQCSSTSRNC